MPTTPTRPCRSSNPPTRASSKSACTTPPAKTSSPSSPKKPARPGKQTSPSPTATVTSSQTASASPRATRPSAAQSASKSALVSCTSMLASGLRNATMLLHLIKRRRTTTQNGCQAAVVATRWLHDVSLGLSSVVRGARCRSIVMGWGRRGVGQLGIWAMRRRVRVRGKDGLIGLGFEGIETSRPPLESKCYTVSHLHLTACLHLRFATTASQQFIVLFALRQASFPSTRRAVLETRCTSASAPLGMTSSTFPLSCHTRFPLPPCIINAQDVRQPVRAGKRTAVKCS